MKFISVRDLRNTPSEVWDALEEGGDLVLTANGRPRALVVRVDEDDLDSTVIALRRARAQVAVSRMRSGARRTGTDRLSETDIEAEIKGARKARQR
jgi:antitoxin (DNA-binding transcriptional repressor) of toxin-antitoxin stability system